MSKLGMITEKVNETENNSSNLTARGYSNLQKEGKNLYKEIQNRMRNVEIPSTSRVMPYKDIKTISEE